MIVGRRQALKTLGGLAAAGLAAPLPARATTADLKGDAAILRDIVVQLHPGLLRYNDMAAIDAGLSRFEHDFLAAPGLDGQYLALTRFLAQLRCGHSYPNFLNQKRAVAAALFDRPTRLPFAFRWIGRAMVVTADHSGTTLLAPGTVIESINGVAAAHMLAAMLPLTRADGGNDGKRRALLGVSGKERFATFDVLHGLLYGRPDGGEHRLAIRRPDGRRATIGVPPLTLAQRQAFLPRNDDRSDAPLWEWTRRADGIALLKMDSWAVYNSKWDWQGWLGERLDSLRGAKGLIVDLRDNEGGNDCGDAILARLATQPLSRDRADRLVRYRRTPDALNPYLDTWDDSFRDWGDRAQPFDDRFLRLADKDDGGVIVPVAPRLDVRMMVLTGPQNSSATFQFANACKASGLGRLVGAATGGNRRGINGGAFFFARLPASGLEFDVPLIGLFPPEDQPDAGIEPDIAIAPTAADIAAGRDPVLAAAVAQFA